jgi:hypothetical protein
LSLGLGAQAPAQVLISPDLTGINETAIRAAIPAIRMVVVGTLDPKAKSEAERVFGVLPGQKVMASVGDAARGEELVTGRDHLTEDLLAFFRMYLPPAFGRSQTQPPKA